MHKFADYCSLMLLRFALVCQVPPPQNARLFIVAYRAHEEDGALGTLPLLSLPGHWHWHLSSAVNSHSHQFCAMISLGNFSDF
jgi:hypothetical protein